MTTSPQPRTSRPGSPVTAGRRITARPEATVPVWAHWHSVLALAPAEAAEITGAVPKAVSFHGLRCEPDAAGRWSASMTIDV